MSTCHWCHVMERESFEDHEVALFLNKNFVSIKVDREERPDIDSVYMSVCQTLTGSGGWPLTIIMTPEKKPFFAGTYFPKEGRYSHPGLLDVLQGVSDAWSTKKDELINSGNKIAEFISKDQKVESGELSEATILGAFNGFKRLFDNEYGGFGAAPKFPTPHNLIFLLRYFNASANEDSLDMVNKTLESMYRGGIFDHIGFGFSRYSTDKKWLVPHFEKMLYDNALLAFAYTEAYQATGKGLYKKVVSNIFDYVINEMTSPEGGFYSALDADSEGIEGKFYAWTVDEIVAVLGEEDANTYCSYYNITHKGNFEGVNIPSLIKSKLDDIENDNELLDRLEIMRKKLFEYRETRVHPYKDDKILTSWNGLMIAAMAYGGRVFNSDSYIDVAKKAVEFIFEKLQKEDGSIYARYREGEAAYPGYLDDYAFLIWGLIELYESTLDIFYLKKSLELNKLMLEDFWDNENGGLFLYSKKSEMLITRPKEIYDGALSSGNSVAALNMLRLAKMTGNDDLIKYVDRLFSAFAGSIKESANSYSFMLTALMFSITPSMEITICGNKESEGTNIILNEINKRYLPFSTFLLNNGSEEINKLIPFTREQKKINNKATAYICNNFACSEPTTEISKLIEKLNEKQRIFQE